MSRIINYLSIVLGIFTLSLLIWHFFTTPPADTSLLSSTPEANIAEPLSLPVDNSEPDAIAASPTNSMNHGQAFSAKPEDTSGNTDNYIDLLWHQASGFKRCGHLPVNQQALQQWKDEAIRLNESSDLIDETDERFQWCEANGFIPARPWLPLMLRAAHAGSKDAQLSLFSTSDEQYMALIQGERLPREHFIEQREQFHQQKLVWITALAAENHIEALEKLVRYWQHGDGLHQPDHAKALFYVEQILQTTDDDDIHRKYLWIREKLD